MSKTTPNLVDWNGRDDAGGIEGMQWESGDCSLDYRSPPLDRADATPYQGIHRSVGVSDYDYIT